MKNEITIFKNEQFGEVRTVLIDNEPWFVGKDVATILGYSNPQKALRDHVEEEDKMGEQNVTPSILDSMGREQYPIWINESGLYNLIFGSKLPNAKQFKKWVTTEVLPSIRKHGAYMTEQTLEQALTDPEFLIKLATQLKEEKEKNKKLETDLGIVRQQLSEATPKATYYDIVLSCKDAMPISVIAKDYGMTAFELNSYLRENNVQYKCGDTWLLKKEFACFGYTDSETNIYHDKKGVEHSKIHTKWTQKGRLFIYELLKKNNILPIVEKEPLGQAIVDTKEEVLLKLN